MIKRKFILLMLLPIFLSSCGGGNTPKEHVCEKPRLDLYILSGQSNMVGYSPINDLSSEEKNKVYEYGWYFASGEGSSNQPNNFNQWKDKLKAGMFGMNSLHFGPEVGMSKFFEKKYIPENNERHVAILKYSQGGSAMYNRWFSSTISEKGNGSQLKIDAAGNPCPDRELDGKVVGDLYYNLVTTCREQIEFFSEHYCVHVVALIWNQGCHDGIISGHAHRYQENLTDFINDFRRDINQKNLPIIIGQIFNSISGCPYASEVARAQKAVSDAMENVDIVLNSDHTQLSAGDAHHSALSMLELGYEQAIKAYEYKIKR